MNAAFLTAAIPEPFTILGRNLKPFSLGHELLFQRFGVNFSVESKDAPRYEDLILGVLLCSQEFDQALLSLQSRWLPLRLKLWAWRCGKFDVAKKMRLFHDYISEATKLPEYRQLREEGDPIKTGAPFVQTLKIYLMEKFGLNSAEALDTPYSLAVWDYFTSQENAGAIHIVTEEDRIEEARIKAEYAALEPKVTEWAERVMAQQRAEGLA